MRTEFFTEISFIQNIKNLEPMLIEFIFWHGEKIFSNLESDKRKSVPAWQDWFEFCKRLPSKKDVRSFRDVFDESYLEK